jgi:hypothetical protein
LRRGSEINDRPISFFYYKQRGIVFLFIGFVLQMLGDASYRVGIRRCIQMYQVLIFLGAVVAIWLLKSLWDYYFAPHGRFWRLMGKYPELRLALLSEEPDVIIQPPKCEVPKTHKQLGIGFANKGLMRGTVVVPIRAEDGTLVGYIGATEARCRLRGSGRHRTDGLSL